MFSLCFAVALVCAGCARDVKSEAGAPSAVPMGAEAVAAEEAPPGTPATEAGAQTAEPNAPAGGSAPTASSDAQPAPSGARPVFRRPEHVRGLYLNAWAAGSKKRVDELIELAKRTEINAFVIDIKDASGYVSHDTQVPLARAIGATNERRIRDLPGLLRKLEAEGIYPIARIVIVRDPVLSDGRPSLAVQNASGQPWHDEKGIVWMNLAQEGVWKYNVDLAEEVARMGFPEIQWDYVRFPDAPRTVMAGARFPGLDEDGRPAAVRKFLAYAHQRLDDLDLDLVVTADVFGITATTEDVGIGQIWERFIDRVDVALPMVYPSHYYPGSFGYKTPNAYPYEVVRRALERAQERSKTVEGAGRTRPFLQDFDLGPPSYGAPEVRAQIQAAYDAGIEEWVLWNAGSKYTEAALQPRDGWKEEPRIRVADKIVPVTTRFDVYKPPQKPDPKAEPRPDTTRPAAAGPHKLERKPVPATGERPAREPRPDRTHPRVLKPDSLRRWIDSVTRARDSVAARQR